MDKIRKAIFGGNAGDALDCFGKWDVWPQRRQRPDPQLGQKLLQGTPRRGGWPSEQQCMGVPCRPFGHLWFVSQTLHSIGVGAWGSLWALSAGLQGRELPLSFPRGSSGQTDLLLMTHLWMSPTQLPLNCPWTALQGTLPLSRDTSPGFLT